MAPSVKEFAEKALRAPTSIAVTMATVHDVVDAVSDALAKGSTNEDRGDAFRLASNGLTLECATCGMLAQDFLEQLYFAGSTLRQVGFELCCPTCGGHAANLWFTPERNKKELSPYFLKHLDELLLTNRSDPDPELHNILREIKLIFTNHVSDAVTLFHGAHADRNLHRLSIVDDAGIVWVVISAIPAKHQDAARFLEETYPPGYGAYFNILINSPAANAAIEAGKSAFAHVIISADGSLTFGLSPLDLKKPGSYKRMLFPNCLTQEDRRRLKL